MAISSHDDGGSEGRVSLTPYGFVFLFGLLVSYALILWLHRTSLPFVSVLVAVLVGITFYFDSKMDEKMRKLRQMNEKRFKRIRVANQICTYIGYVLFIIGAGYIVVNTIPDF